MTTAAGFIWGNYGRFVEKPMVSAVICISVLAINIGLILGSEMWAVPLATDISKLWIDPASQVASNNKHVEVFGSSVDVSSNELITLGNVDGENMLTPAGFGKFAEYMDIVLNTVAFHNGTAYTILDVCNGRNGQVPYTFGCGINSPIDYFKEGSEYFPLDGATQWVLESKVIDLTFNSTSAKATTWGWIISADLIANQAGSPNVFYTNWFNADCLVSKRLLCDSAHNPTVIDNVDTLIAAPPTFPQVAKLQMAWTKASLVLGGILGGLAGGPGTCASSPTSLTATTTPPITLNGKVNSTTLAYLQSKGYVDGQTHTMADCAVGPGYAPCTTPSPCTFTALQSLQPFQFNACATCIIATMYWAGELQVIATVGPQTTDTVPAGALSQPTLKIFQDPISTGRAISAGIAKNAADLAPGTSCSNAHPEVSGAQCSALWDQFVIVGTNPAVALTTVAPRVGVLVTLNEEPLDALFRTNPGLDVFAYYRGLLQAELIPQLVSPLRPVLFRHNARPSYVGKDTAALGLTLSGFKNDLATQNLRAAIFGASKPHPREIRAGSCACSPGFSGLQCSVTGVDPICDCDTSLKPTCLQGLLGSCIQIASCATYPVITALVASAGSLGLNSTAIDDFAHFSDEMAVAAAFTASSTSSTGVLLMHCQQYLPCVDNATSYAGSSFTTMGPAGYSGILEDASWNAALLLDFQSSSPTVFSFYQRAGLLQRAFQGTYAGAMAQGADAATALTLAKGLLDAYLSASIPTPDPTGLQALLGCTISATDASSCTTQVSATPLPTTCPHVQGVVLQSPADTTVKSYFLCAAEIFQPFLANQVGLVAPRTANSISYFPKGQTGSLKVGACAQASVSTPVGMTLGACKAAIGAFLFTGVGTVVAGSAPINLAAFSGGSVLADATQKANQGLAVAKAGATSVLFRDTVKGQAFSAVCPASPITYENCATMKNVIDAILLGSCALSKANFQTLKLEKPACEALVENLGGALQRIPSSVAVVSRALAKYKFMGTIAGACSQAGGSAIGGGDCWIDADCSGHGTCANLTQAVALSEVGVFATILLTNSPNGTVGIMKKFDAKYRELANAPIFDKYQARMDAKAGRRLEPVDFGVLGPIPGLSEHDADQILRKWRIAVVENVAEFRESNPALRADVVTADSPENLLNEISEADPKILILGYGLMLLYTFLSCTNWSTDVPAMLNGSRALVGMAGILMVAISVASGLGVSHLLGVEWSAAATQIVPFVMLGLGVSDTFVMLRIWPYYQDGLSAAEAASKALTVAGPPMLLVSATNAGVFAVGVLTAMPVVVNFALQAVIVTIANYLTTNLMLPALLILDYKRMAAGRMDMAPCVHVGSSARAQVASESTGYEMNMFNRCLTPCYAKCLMSIPGKIFVIALSFAFLGAAVYGVDKVAELGLQLADIAPAGSDLANALNTRDSAFGFYTISLITGEADWSRREVQQGLVKIFNDVMATEKVVDASGTPWIQVMMQWGQVSTPDYSNSDTADKLCNPSNSRTGGKCGQSFNCTVETADDSVVNGSIPFFNATIFYRCLEHWINSDLGYEALKPGFKLLDEFAPKGSRQLYFSRDDETGKFIPFSRGTLFTLGLSTNPDFVQLIEEVRAVANSDTTPPSFIIGEPIDFWDQYVSLTAIINRSVGYSLLICFFIIWFLLICLVEGDAGLVKRIFATFWASALTTGIIALTVYEIYGFMAYAGIKISAIPAISIIMSTGVAVEYTAYIAVAFLNGAGTYNQRLEHSLMLMLAPVVDGGVTMFLGVVMLAASPFVFIVKYFFYPWLFIIFFGMFNGIAFLPVVFSLVGPPAVKSGARTEPGTKEVSNFNKM